MGSHLKVASSAEVVLLNVYAEQYFCKGATLNGRQMPKQTFKFCAFLEQAYIASFTRSGSV